MPTKDTLHCSSWAVPWELTLDAKVDFRLFYYTSSSILAPATAVVSVSENIGFNVSIGALVHACVPLLQVFLHSIVIVLEYTVSSRLIVQRTWESTTTIMTFAIGGSQARGAE